ncbi:hypothetical protein JW977_02950 [Candidatus Falkowbacteria bacterium]|nr:hypothetical protein [Candidatus Falkowbacteria bacterium]
MTKCKIFRGDAEKVEKSFDSFFKASDKKVLQVIPSVEFSHYTSSEYQEDKFALVVIFTQK